MARRKHSAKATFEKASLAATEQTLAIYNMGWDPDSGEPMSAEHAEFLRARNITAHSERAAQRETHRLFNKAVVDGMNRHLNRSTARDNTDGDVERLEKKFGARSGWRLTVSFLDQATKYLNEHFPRTPATSRRTSRTAPRQTRVRTPESVRKTIERSHLK